MKQITHTTIYRLQSLSLCLSLCLSLHAQGITVPRTASPHAVVTQTIGISTVTVDYSRPSVKGRKIWGDLVPYGWNVQPFGNMKPAPWRAGANENTTVTFSHDAKVEGQAVPKGTYGLFFTIHEDNTGEVILSKDYRSWGSFFYEPTRDQLRTTIKLRDIPMTELLTYDVINLTRNSGELVLNWEKKQFPVKVEFAVDDIVLANAADELKGPIGFTWQGYNSAANYAMQNKLNPDLALMWADRAITMNRNFNTLMVKANILRNQGKIAEATNIETEAMSFGNEAEVNAYGYQLLNEGKHDEAIRIFKINTERHPMSANTWDSLGEAYFIKGDKEKAIANFKKSLTLNPTEATKANSMNYLKKLGAN
jgi:hypothetical protein